MWARTKTKPWVGTQPPPDGRPRHPGKRTRREDHALLIVRDEFRTGYSLIGLLASIARLRFTGTVRIALDRGPGKAVSSNGYSVFSLVSHEWGSPQVGGFFCANPKFQSGFDSILLIRREISLKFSFQLLATNRGARKPWLAAGTALAPAESSGRTLPISAYTSRGLDWPVPRAEWRNCVREARPQSAA
jgi:hypothetical protein